MVTKYRIMQIVRGGKVSWLHDFVIHRKTFAIVQQFETPYNKKKFTGKPLRSNHRERFALYGIFVLCGWPCACVITFKAMELQGSTVKLKLYNLIVSKNIDKWTNLNKVKYG